MSTDDVTAAAKQVRGSIKEAIGKLTGDTRTEAEGAADKAGIDPEALKVGVDKASKPASASAQSAPASPSLRNSPTS